MRGCSRGRLTRPRAKGVGSLPVLRRVRESRSLVLACLTFHFPLESALSVVSKRKVEINTMAHRPSDSCPLLRRQIEILRKIDPPYVRCGTRWKFIPLASTFSDARASRAFAHFAFRVWCISLSSEISCQDRYMKYRDDYYMMNNAQSIYLFPTHAMELRDFSSYYYYKQ